MEKLDTLVQEAYKIFSPYKMEENFGVCTEGCCMCKESIHAIQNGLLRDIPRFAINDFLDAACSENIVLINNMKYLLPRVLELLVAGENIRHSHEITLNQLYCKNTIWQKKEIEFLERFAVQYFKSQIQKQNPEIELMQIVIMFDNAGLNVTDKFLSLLLKNAHRTSVIYDMVNILTYEIKNGEYAQSFADKRLIAKVTHWLTSKTVKETFLQVILSRVDSTKMEERDRFLYECAFDTLTYFDNEY